MKFHGGMCAAWLVSWPARVLSAMRSGSKPSASVRGLSLDGSDPSLGLGGVQHSTREFTDDYRVVYMSPRLNENYLFMTSVMREQTIKMGGFWGQHKGMIAFRKRVSTSSICC